MHYLLLTDKWKKKAYILFIKLKPFFSKNIKAKKLFLSRKMSHYYSNKKLITLKEFFKNNLWLFEKHVPPCSFSFF